MRRYRFDGLTLGVLLLSILMLNVLLFSAGIIVGTLRDTNPAPARVARAVVHVAPQPLGRATSNAQAFVMPRWTPPAEPAPMLIAQREPAPAPAARYARRSDYMALIEETAYRESVPPYLVAAIMSVESNFDARAVSNKGARGLMQVMPGTARRFGFNAERLHDPVHNIAAGATYLRWLLERYDGDLDRVLAAYNAGEGAVDTYKGIPPYKETQNFVKRVRSVLEKSTSSRT
ncbi:MAG TPA: lytic transglycosylase domain-containing protein [Thermoanaerobaculia bacterium]|jgi:soluble lytic murein transglycosylase-like protein